MARQERCHGAGESRMLLTSVCIFGEDTQAWMRVSRGPKPFFTEGPCEPTARLLSKRQSRCARALDRTLSLHRQGHALHLTAPHLRQCRPFPTGYLQLHKRARISKDQSLGFGKILTHGDAIHLANLVACKHCVPGLLTPRLVAGINSTAGGVTGTFGTARIATF